MKKVLIAAIMIFMAAVTLYSAPYMIGHITTCSGLMDNSYPADSTNWFYRNQHRAVQYWAYILFPAGTAVNTNIKNKYYLFVNPYELYSGGAQGETGGDDYSFENKWFSPSGKLICEKIMSWKKSSSDKRVTAGGRQYIPYTFADFIGINQTFPENGQDAIPSEQGLYHIELYINGELASVTFFEMKD